MNKIFPINLMILLIINLLNISLSLPLYSQEPDGTLSTLYSQLSSLELDSSSKTGIKDIDDANKKFTKDTLKAVKPMANAKDVQEHMDRLTSYTHDIASYFERELSDSSADLLKSLKNTTVLTCSYCGKVFPISGGAAEQLRALLALDNHELEHERAELERAEREGLDTSMRRHLVKLKSITYKYHKQNAKEIMRATRKAQTLAKQYTEAYIKEYQKAYERERARLQEDVEYDIKKERQAREAEERRLRHLREMRELTRRRELAAKRESEALTRAVEAARQYARQAAETKLRWSSPQDNTTISDEELFGPEPQLSVSNPYLDEKINKRIAELNILKEENKYKGNLETTNTPSTNKSSFTDSNHSSEDDSSLTVHSCYKGGCKFYAEYTPSAKYEYLRKKYPCCYFVCGKNYTGYCWGGRKAGNIYE